MFFKNAPHCAFGKTVLKMRVMKVRRMLDFCYCWYCLEMNAMYSDISIFQALPWATHLSKLAWSIWDLYTFNSMIFQNFSSIKSFRGDSEHVQYHVFPQATRFFDNKLFPDRTEALVMVNKSSNNIDEAHGYKITTGFLYIKNNTSFGVSQAFLAEPSRQTLLPLAVELKLPIRAKMLFLKSTSVGFKEKLQRPRQTILS